MTGVREYNTYQPRDFDTRDLVSLSLVSLLTEVCCHLLLCSLDSN